jgi:hypothetical protein
MEIKKRDYLFRDKFFPKNNKGQFFLIAAIIIIVVTVGVITITNYTEEKEAVKLYDLGEELGIESQRVLDHGTYRQLDEGEMKTLMENFIQNYVDYIGETGNLYFVFGNFNRIYAVGYQQVELGQEEVCIKLDDESECQSLTTMEETQEFPAPTSEGISIVTIIIGEEGNAYTFKLKEGENFYFVIWQKFGGEKVVITSDDV